MHLAPSMACSSSDVRELIAAAPTCRLPRGITVLDVSEECRRVALFFVTDTLPTKRGLEEWLEDSYRSLVSVVDPDIRRAPVRVDPVTENAAYVRAYVLAAIRDISRPPSDVSFTRAAIHDGWIERCCDSTGSPGWVPVDRPNMRLTERVLSLVAVDYLLRPMDWLDGRIVSEAARLRVAI